MTAAEVRADAGPVRLFSVDGGHTADITASDLALAEASLCPGGIVILDDYFNEAWPGVSEGATRYLGAGTSTLVPVAIGGNKFVFTNSKELAGKYREALCGLPENYVVKEQTAFDQPVVVVQPKVAAADRSPCFDRVMAAGQGYDRRPRAQDGRSARAAALRREAAGGPYCPRRVQVVSISDRIVP